jgi:hypothetical protein
MAEEKRCLACGEPLKGRVDKKFCDDQCRSQYNNRNNSDTTTKMRNVNNILRKNRRILQQALADSFTARMPKTRLTEKGFNTKYHTHTYTTRDDHTYVFCYEYGYLPLKNDSVVVVKWKKEWVD